MEKPVRSYEEYFREKGWGSEVKKIVELSNAENVKRIDALVAQFNAERERIIREKDQKNLDKFLRQVELIIRGRA